MGKKKVNGVSGTEYRRKKGFSRQRLHALKKKGKIKTTPDGKIDEQASDEAIRAAQQATQSQYRNPSRQVKDYYDAKSAEVDYKERIGKLVPKEDVEREAFQIGRQVRDALMNLPNRLAGVLAPETDQEKVRGILTVELRKALEALTK